MSRSQSTLPSRSLLGPAFVAMLFLAPRIAEAQGAINLSWDDCGPFGRAQKNFACDANAGSATLVLSELVLAPVKHIVGMRAVIEIFTAGAPMSPWWRLDPAGCRAGSLSVDFDFAQGTSGCADLWGGSAFGGFDFTPDYAPGVGLLKLSCAVAGEVADPGADEVATAKLTLDFARSAGPGRCAGCADGTCIHFSCAQLLQPAGMPSYILVNPLQGTTVAFQPLDPGSFATGCPPVGYWSCPGPVPALKPTWGQIKSLYR